MNNLIIKYFALLYDDIHFPIQVINDKGKIVYTNKAFSLYWGFNLSELEEYSFFTDSELKRIGAADLMQKFFEVKESIIINDYSDSLLKSKETTLPVLRTKVFPVNYNNEAFAVLLHEDQTEMYLAEEEIKKSRDGNKEASRLKDTFLNVLSHELRTPLNIVLGYASIIKEGLKDKISSEDKVYLDNLYSGSERLFKSITQMLEFAQIEAGNFKLSTETIDIISLLHNCIYSVTDSAREKKIDIKTVFGDKPVYVDVDVHCLENAVNNLLHNAVKFTRQGFVEIEVNVLKEREIAVCKIKDSGVGISNDYLDHLFRPFSQEDLNISRNYEGNGLGLALAKRYLEKMGGSLLVDSIKGVGSTFTFTLPLSHNSSKKEKENIEKSNEINKILMLDDSDDSFELLRAFLKGSHIIEAYNFRDFKFDLINNNEYKVIIFDVSQAHWDQSLIICKELKRSDPFRRPLIVISSEFADEKIREFYHAGADKFLVKPFSKNDLLNAIDKALV